MHVLRQWGPFRMIPQKGSNVITILLLPRPFIFGSLIYHISEKGVHDTTIQTVFVCMGVNDNTSSFYHDGN
jgi:hypothetical protein